MKLLRITLAVFSLILAAAVPASAQASVFVNGNKSFTVTWSGKKEGATLLAQATFTVSEWTGTSFKMTVTNAQNTMLVTPDYNARLTAFGFGLTPEGTFSALVPGSIYQWAFTNFPAFQRVDVCLTSGGTCGGGGFAGLDQGQSSPETYSLTISGAFTNGVTIIPIPAKFQTALGSLETDGVVIDPPPPVINLDIKKSHSPAIALPGGIVTYTVTVKNVGTSPSIAPPPVTVTETPPPGLTVTALSGTGWTCTEATRICTRSDALAPNASYPEITVTTVVDAGVKPGTLTNTVVVSGGGDPDPGTATDSTIIGAPTPVSPSDLTIAKRHSPLTVVPGQTFSYFITVSNVGGSSSSSPPPVTVIETPPAGLTVTALEGDAPWSCTFATLTCTRSDALAAKRSYPEITVTAVVGASVAPGIVTNTAVVSGGGETNKDNNTATDPTEIKAPASGPDLTITKTHSGPDPVRGQLTTFTVRVTNVGSSPTTLNTDDPVKVTEVPPPGLTITALSGSGWTCIVRTLTCLRTSPTELAPKASYPDITVTARISPNATGSLGNRAVVSGGGDVDPGNSIGTSPITLPPLPVPALPLLFGIGLMSALFATALWALRMRTS